MHRRDVLKILAAAVLGAIPWTLLANGMRLASQDGMATARGEAFVATADNPSAVYYNPAGIAYLAGDNVRGGIYGIYLDPTFRPPRSSPDNGRTYGIQDKLAAAPNVFYTHGSAHAPLSFGLGVYAPFGGSMSWPQDTGFRAVALRSSLQYVTLNPVIALKVAPHLSVGGGLMVNYANMKLEQGLRPSYLPPNTNYFRFAGEGWSVGYNLGLLYQPHEKVAIGATLRSAATVTLAGRTEFEQYTLGIAATRRPAQAEFEFPLTVVFGLSYRPTPQWNLEFDADHTDWRSFGTIPIRQQGQLPLGWPQNPPVTLNWQGSWMYEFGATRLFNHGWHASGGYVFNENSVPNAYYTPLVADLDRHFFSLGAGHKGKRLNFDVAYQFGYGPAHTVTGSKPPSLSGVFAGQNADGTYDFISHAVMLTLGIGF